MTEKKENPINEQDIDDETLIQDTVAVYQEDELDETIELDDSGMPIEEEVLDDEEFYSSSTEVSQASEGADNTFAQELEEAGAEVNTLKDEIEPTTITLDNAVPEDEELSPFDETISASTLTIEGSDEIEHAPYSEEAQQEASFPEEIVLTETLGTTELADPDVTEGEAEEIAEAEAVMAEMEAEAVSGATEPEEQPEDMYSGLEEQIADPGAYESPISSNETAIQDDFLSPQLPADDSVVDEDAWRKGLEEPHEQSHTREEEEPDYSRMFDENNENETENSDSVAAAVDPASQVVDGEEYIQRRGELTEFGGLTQEELADSRPQLLGEIQEIPMPGNEETENDEADSGYEEEMSTEELELSSDDSDLFEVDEQEAREFADNAGSEEFEEYEMYEDDEEEEFEAVTELLFGRFEKPNTAQKGILAAALLAVIYFSWGAFNKNSERSRIQQNYASTQSQTQPAKATPVEVTSLSAEQRALIEQVNGGARSADRAGETSRIEPIPSEPQQIGGENNLPYDRGDLPPISKRNSKEIADTISQTRETDARILTEILERIGDIEKTQADLASTNQTIMARQEETSERVARVQKTALENTRTAKASNVKRTPTAVDYNQRRGNKTYTALRRVVYGSSDTPQSTPQEDVAPIQLPTLSMSEQINALKRLPVHPKYRVTSATNNKARIVDGSCNSKIYNVGEKVEKGEKIEGILGGYVYTNRYRIPIETSGRCSYTGGLRAEALSNG